MHIKYYVFFITSSIYYERIQILTQDFPLFFLSRKNVFTKSSQHPEYPEPHTIIFTQFHHNAH